MLRIPNVNDSLCIEFLEILALDIDLKEDQWNLFWETFSVSHEGISYLYEYGSEDGKYDYD